MTDGLATAGAAADAAIAETPNATGSTRLRLISVSALLVILTMAVTFFLPPLLPKMQEQYHITTVSAVTWIFTLGTLGGSAGFIVLPKLSDVRGDRLAAVIGGVTLTAGALIIAVFSTSYLALLIGSAVMGFGGAAHLLPLGFLRRTLGESGLAISVAVLIMSTGVGIVAGMIGGGYIVERLSVQTFFLVLAAAFALTAVAMAIVVPTQSSLVAGRVPVVGTIWLIVWIGALMLALTQGLEWGVTALIPLAIGIVGAVSWIVFQRRTPTPVFDPAVVTSPAVILSCFVVTMIAIVNSAFLVLLSNFAQMKPEYLPAGESYGLGLTTVQTGLVMIPFAITFAVGGAIAERPVAEGRGLSVFVGGSIVAAIGLALIIVAPGQLWSYVVAAGVVGFGCSVVYSACLALAQHMVREDKAGMAGAMAGTAMAIGFSIGSAIVTTVLGWSTVVIPGTDMEVAARGQFTAAYWITIGITALILIAVAATRSRIKTPDSASRI